MQFQYFADPSHDTEAYREIAEQWWDGLCLPHVHRNDFFCHEKDHKFGFPNMHVLLLFLYFFPPIIYTTFVSIRFYGAKNWLNGVLGNPAYFILPVTTCLSFYEETNSSQNKTDRNVPYDNQGLYLDNGESQENQKVHSSEDSFQLTGMGMKQADETQSNTNSHDQKSIEDQVVSNVVDQENDSQHAVVSICEVREEQLHGNSEAKNHQTLSESNTESSSVKEENKTNSSTSSMEMTFSVSQSNVLYGYYLCETTFTLLLLYLGYDGKFSSVIFLRHIS